MRKASAAGQQEGYDPDFFESNAQSAIESAREIVPLVLRLSTPSSVVDVGCGSGGWLRVFAEHGVCDYLGLDQECAADEHLQIPPEHFVATNLTEVLTIPGRFDLALCLEVVEHLPLSVGIRLVHQLTQLAPIVLFSAGTPIQPGTGHITGRWPKFWASEFAQHGFLTLDVIRKSVWSNHRVSFWYAQNMMLFVDSRYYATHPDLHKITPSHPEMVRSLIHPGLFTHGLSLLVRRPKSTLLKMTAQLATFAHSFNGSL